MLSERPKENIDISDLRKLNQHIHPSFLMAK